MTQEELSERLWDFALRIGKVVDALPETRLGRHVAGQLVRCGTSPAPNYDEACALSPPERFRSQVSYRPQRTEGVKRVASLHY